jgi:hypothetical protein
LWNSARRNSYVPESTAVVSGVVTGIRLFVVVVLKKVLRAVMLGGY